MDWTPYRRLLARVIWRAVMDIINNTQIKGAGNSVTDPVVFLNDPATRLLMFAGNVSVPWRQIDQLIKQRGE